ncbi:YopX family protein [Tenacibaculum maritimum]|uniref:YopX family protein n=1 Tax=Tenacibaculum maritimum TaxID=107401 RepID=UPI0012E54CC7|nr:YopX family protein [Tenacibaculum maritimum]CAA0254261.1 hypothetical protein DPIF8902391_90067 [Tenacibaculum maritimum]
MINDNDIFDNGFNRGRKYPSYITQKGVHYIKPYDPIIKSECSCGGYYSDWDKELIYKDVEIMQSTGLKSKGGKEVYEGDIFRHEEETEHGDIRTYSVVMWIKQRGAYYLIPCDHYQVIRDNDVSKEEEFEWLFEDAILYDFNIDVGLDLVGNLYENPELVVNDIEVTFEEIKE